MTLADRLVVMNAGMVEQVGTPLDIYEKPASTFVAGFIGAPPMNLLPVTMGDKGFSFADGSAVSARDRSRQRRDLRLPAGRCRRRLRRGHAAGALSLPAEVEAVEPVGAESFLYCAAAGSRIVVRVAGRALAKPGDKLNVVARAEKLHWFDASGKRV